MSLLPADAPFEEKVQDCFLAFRGSGLMLSPLDAELLSEWAQAKVPYEVVARGIRRAAERALWDAREGESPLHTLRSCRRDVKAEIKKYQDRAVGESNASSEPGSLHEARHQRLRRALKKFAKLSAAFAPVVGRLLSGVLAAAPVDLAQAAYSEDLAVAMLCRALPFPERVALCREVRARTSDASTLSANARHLFRRFHRAAHLRLKTQLPSFW